MVKTGLAALLAAENSMPKTHSQLRKHWPSLLAVALAGGLFCPVAGQSAAPAPAWKAGAASAQITPESNMWMAGYAARTKPSEGVELDLFAKALVVEDQAGTKWALITLDLIGVPRSVRLFMAEQAEKQFGIAPAHVVLNASHTHSGPELRTGRTYRSDDVARHNEEAAAANPAIALWLQSTPPVGWVAELGS